MKISERTHIIHSKSMPTHILGYHVVHVTKHKKITHDETQNKYHNMKTSLLIL